MAYTSVKISANSSDYQSQMKSAAAQMKVLSAEYTTAATKAKLFGSETDSLKAKAESLTQKITVQKGIVQLNSDVCCACLYLKKSVATCGKRA